MASIPLPALHINPPADPSEGMQKILAIKAMMDQSAQQRALMPGQLQQQKQTLEAGQQENAMRAQQMKDQQAMTAAYKAWDGKDPAGLAKLVTDNGGSANARTTIEQHYLGLKKTYSDIAKTDTETGQKNLEIVKNKNDMALGAINAAEAVPDEQLAQHLAETVSSLTQKGLIDQQHQQVAAHLIQGMQSGQIDAKTARAQLDLYKKDLQGNSEQISQAAKEAETRKNQAETEKTNQELQYGPSGVAADSKYRFLQQRLAQKLPIQAEDQAFIAGYEKQKKLVPMATAQVRVEGLQQSREYPVINKETGELEMRNAAEINAGKGKYAPAGEGAKAMNKTALIEDIRGNISSVRELLSNPKLPEFSADQRGEIAIALGKQDSQSALTAMFRGGVLGSLTEEQQDYLIRMAQLKENAMAMRSVLGAGQGSEDLRAAITATIPGPRTPSKQYALKQLEQFENVLNRLERGIPNVPLRPQQPSQPAPQSQPANDRGAIQQGEPTAKGPAGHMIVYRNGKWRDPMSGLEVTGKK